MGLLSPDSMESRDQEQFFDNKLSTKKFIIVINFTRHLTCTFVE